MPRPATGALLVLSLTLTGCALKGPSSRSTDYFVQLAEGLTSATLTEGIRVAPRMFAASQLVEACKDPRVVDHPKGQHVKNQQYKQARKIKVPKHRTN